MKRTLVVAVAACLLFGLVIAGCGAPKQKEVTERSKAEQAETKKNELEITNLGFLPHQNNPYLNQMQMYYVVAKLKNNNSGYACIGADCSATLYNAGGAVIGNYRGDMAPVYPGQERWYVSNSIDTSPETPARAELKISNEKWSKTPAGAVPKLEIVQKNVLPGEYETKITGVMRYSGKTAISAAVTGVVLNSGGNPVACGRADLENISAGDHPFGIETFMGNIDATSADVTAFKTK